VEPAVKISVTVAAGAIDHKGVFALKITDDNEGYQELIIDFYGREMRTMALII
jgi:hypothetical protein